MPGRMPALGEDHPRRRGQRSALDLQAGHLLVTDTGAELVTGVAVTHRVSFLCEGRVSSAAR
jgi:hypothetical protein